MTLEAASNPKTLRHCGSVLAISKYLLAWHLTQQKSLLFTKYICQDWYFLQVGNKLVGGLVLQKHSLP